MKSINEIIKEGRQNKYTVSLIDCKDNENLPISVNIYIDKANVKEFEKYIEDEQDNIFAHAQGGNIEY